LGGTKQRPDARECLSMVAGFAGVVLLTFSGSESSDGSYWIYAAFLLVATVIWAIGTVWTSKEQANDSLFLASSMQMIWGGSLNLCLSFFKGEMEMLPQIQVSGSSVLALGYLIVFGTILAFVSYNFLLKTTDASLVASHAYVNPLVALIAGAVFLGERLSYTQGWSVLFILAAVFFSLRIPQASKLKKGAQMTVTPSLTESDQVPIFRGFKQVDGGARLGDA